MDMWIIKKKTKKYLYRVILTTKLNNKNKEEKKADNIPNATIGLPDPDDSKVFLIKKKFTQLETLL